MGEAMERRCPSCEQMKGESEYYGTAPYCKSCWAEYKKESRQRPENRLKINAAANAWLKSHPAQNRKNVEQFRVRQQQQRQKERQARIPPNTVSARAAAARLGISRQRLHQLREEGRLGATRQGREWFIDQSDIERYRAEVQGREVKDTNQLGCGEDEA